MACEPRSDSRPRNPQAFNSVLDSQAAIEQARRSVWVGQPLQGLVQACAARQLQPDGDAQVLVERLVRQECENDPRYYASQAEIWFQVGHVRELTQDYHAAKEAYERVLDENAAHAKALQQLGWLYHNIPHFSAPYGSAPPHGGAAAAAAAGGGGAAAAAAADSGAGANQEIAVKYLQRSIEANPSDDQAWYLLGRCYMTQREYTKAHKAYERAVNINDSDPTYWCSIGVLYYYNQQFHDALDTYSRALQLNPELSEIWCVNLPCDFLQRRCRCRRRCSYRCKRS
jgi:tetratricopeptide (TPR) repeat protein